MPKMLEEEVAAGMEEKTRMMKNVKNKLEGNSISSLGHGCQVVKNSKENTLIGNIQIEKLDFMEILLIITVCYNLPKIVL